MSTRKKAFVTCLSTVGVLSAIILFVFGLGN